MATAFFVESDKLILKFTQNCKGPRTAKTILKMNKVERLTLLNCKTCYKATAISVFLQRHVDQWNIIERKKPHIFMVN